MDSGCLFLGGFGELSIRGFFARVWIKRSFG